MRNWAAGSASDSELPQRVLASLMEASPHAMVVADDCHRITNANPEFAQWVGLAPSDLVGRAVTEVLAELGPGALACWEQVTARVRTEGACREITAHLSPPAGSGPREVLVNAMRVGSDGHGRTGTPIVAVWRDVTEERRAGRVARAARDAMRQAEDSARQAAARFQVLFDCAQDCIFIKNRSLVYTEANAAMGRLFGMPPAEIVGKTDVHLFGEAAAAETAEYDRRVLAGETLEFEQTKPVGGVPATFHVIKAPMRDESGAVWGLGGIARDVTHRWRIMRGLERREAILGAVVFAAERFLSEPDLGLLPQVLARLGRAARVSRVYVCSHRGTARTGPEDLDAAWESPDLAPADGDAHRLCCGQAGLERWDALLQRGEIIRGHVRDLPADERAVLARRGVRSLVVVPIRVGNTWWGRIGFDECVTPREWLPAEVDALMAAAGIIGAAVQRQRSAPCTCGSDDFERLLASIAADFITVRPEQIDVGIERALEGICRYAGARRSRVYTLSDDGQRVLNPYGWSADPGIAVLPAAAGLSVEGFGPIREVLARGVPLVIATASDWTPEIAQLLALFDGDGFRPLIQVPMFRGQTLRGALTIAGVPGQECPWPEGILPRLRFAAQVIESALERKATEGRLRREAEEFERLAVARRARILELERQRGVDEKLAATGRMATRIAHEINNPLAGIKSAFQLVKDAVPPEHTYHSYIGRIEREIDRIAVIVGQMLDLHRPQPESAQRFSAREAIEDVEALLASECQRTETALAVALAPGPMEVRLPRGAFVQVLYNILVNALDASSRGGQVRLAACIRGARLHVKVFDRGPGIPREVAAQIFEPFFTTKTGGAGRGVGLGLSISRSLVAAMGGSLRFRSRQGRGTLFHLVMPAESGAAEVQRA